MESSDFALAIVGLGVWGTHLVRVANILGCTVHGFDRSPAKRRMRDATLVTMHTSYRSLLTDPTIRAVVIATPSQTHYRLAYMALAAGKHVLVEKPLTQDSKQAKTLARIAERTQRILMVDHTFLYSDIIMKAKTLIDTGALGRIGSISSTRCGGAVRPESTVLWDLAVHDVAIARLLMGSNPIAVQATSLSPDSASSAVCTLWHENGVRYDCTVSWISTRKIRRIVLTGTHGICTLSWNGPIQSLTVRQNGKKTKEDHSTREPLHTMMRAFLTRIQNPTTEADLREGVDVVHTVTALHASLEHHAGRVPITSL